MFYTKNLQTQNEIAFFEKLKYVFQDYHIATQVALSAIIETDNFRQRPLFNTYYVDYVICDKKGEKPLLIIELDDKTHKSEKRQNQDKRKNGVIQATGIPFIRYKSKTNYNITDIANETMPYLKGTKTPPIYETLPITESTTPISNFDYNNTKNQFVTKLKKYLFDRLIKIAASFVAIIFIAMLVFVTVSVVIPAVITKSIKETQKSVQINKTENNNETHSPVPVTRKIPSNTNNCETIK
jgi:very-short-patch-repair endonuclease